MISTPLKLTPLTNLQLAKTRFGLTIPHIEAAVLRSEKIHQKLSDALADAAHENCGLVVFGSLARREMTSGSDVDWTLLIDGPADSRHRENMQLIEAAMKRLGEDKALPFSSPNATGAFGAMTFSHDLVHAIGGEADSNKNTTKRILLLLEAVGISRQTPVVDRVVRSILDRYFQQVIHPCGNSDYFPRFLLNDVVRLWRTMAVDYAAKNSDRNRDAWALRSAKLRFSRKLIFVSGLLLTYETMLQPVDVDIDPIETASLVPALIEHVQPITRLPPLEVLAQAIIRESNLGWAGAAESAKLIFETYDEFLGMMDDVEKRHELKNLKFENAAKDPNFDRIREISRVFQEGLDKFLLEGPERVRNLTKAYAIF